MIVDTSAVLAVLFDATDADRFATSLYTAPNRSMSVVSFVEAAMVLESRQGAEVGARLDAFLVGVQIALAPVTPEQAELARDAWRRFGRGNHSAALNLGDCFAYALAKDTGEPLLFKGNDFTLTDIPAA